MRRKGEVILFCRTCEEPFTPKGETSIEECGRCRSDKDSVTDGDPMFLWPSGRAWKQTVNDVDGWVLLSLAAGWFLGLLGLPPTGFVFVIALAVLSLACWNEFRGER